MKRYTRMVNPTGLVVGMEIWFARTYRIVHIGKMHYGNPQHAGVESGRRAPRRAVEQPGPPRYLAPVTLVEVA